MGHGWHERFSALEFLEIFDFAELGLWILLIVVIIWCLNRFWMSKDTTAVKS
jgi:flagellar biogenesis protein FliO